MTEQQKKLVQEIREFARDILNNQLDTNAEVRIGDGINEALDALDVVGKCKAVDALDFGENGVMSGLVSVCDKCGRKLVQEDKHCSGCGCEIEATE
jgi:hypothetical protein